MRIVVTGGAGFIGSHLVDLLAKKQNDVLIVDDLSSGRIEWVNQLIMQSKSRVHFELCRVQDGVGLPLTLESFRPEAIFHLAAQPAIGTSWDDPVANATVNELGTLQVVLCARDVGCKKIVLASTSAVYADYGKNNHGSIECHPTNPYGISKFAAEQYLRCMFRESVVLRLGNVYGPRQVPLGLNQVIPKMLRHFLYGDDFAIHGDGNQKRDFVYVGDVAEAFMLALWAKPGTYNVATGTRVSINELSRMIAAIYEVDKYQWEHTPDQDPRRDVVLDIAPTLRELGWKPKTELCKGLEATSIWWNEQRK